MSKLSCEQIHTIMAAVKCADTSIEIKLRKALWHRGIRYRKNFRLYNSRPDIVITKHKIAIFCDGDFWHGKKGDGQNIRVNRGYWVEKIKRNVERDLENTIDLRDHGWTVLRFWESDINSNLDMCIKDIMKEIRQKITK